MTKLKSQLLDINFYLFEQLTCQTKQSKYSLQVSIASC